MTSLACLALGCHLLHLDAAAVMSEQWRICVITAVVLRDHVAMQWSEVGDSRGCRGIRVKQAARGGGKLWQSRL